MALANSVALRMAKITKETKDPPGGTIVRDPKTGEPTGVLKDDAMGLVYAPCPTRARPRYDEALTASLAEAARVGVTSIQDITPWRDYEVYKRVSRRRPFDCARLRAHSDEPVETAGRLVARQGSGRPLAKAWRAKGIYGRLARLDDRALFSSRSTMRPNTSGLMVDDNIPEGKLKKKIKDADKAGLQCSIHAIGDKANNLLLNYFEEVAQRERPARPAVSHRARAAPSARRHRALCHSSASSPRCSLITRLTMADGLKSASALCG